MQDHINAAFPSAAFPPAQHVIGLDELSQLLHKNAATIIADRSRAPYRVPPSCEPPGSRTPLWIVEDVLNWLRIYQRPAVPAPEAAPSTPKHATDTANDQAPRRRRGRPTKAEQAARAAAAAQQGGAA